MEIAYLGKMQLTDVDLSYLHSIQKKADVTYILEVNPRFQHGPAFSITKIYRKVGVFKAIEAYPELTKFEDFIDTNNFYIVNSWGRLWVLRAIWANILLLFFLIRLKTNVIHLTWPLNVYEFPLYLLHKKMTMTVHDPFPHTELNTRIVRLRRWTAFHFVNHFVILNKAQKGKFLRTYNIPENRVYTSKLSCYTCLQAIKPNTSLIPKGRYILFAGKVSAYKGIDYLLQAMQEVHKKHPDVLLVIAGAGQYPFDIKPFLSLDYLDIRNRFIPNEELVALINGAEFMVCPYIEATQSGVIMSSYAFNTPIIATDVGGLPEMVENGKYGLIVPPKDKDKLANAISLLLENQGLRDEIIHHIRRDYSLGELSWEYISCEFSEYYHQITKQE